LKEQLAELKTTIQAQQQQLQQISSLRAEIAELRNLHQPISTPSPARKKVSPNAQTLESHLSEASVATREDDDAAMDHE
jgi:DNA repair exonuclease SbcCD ATPase subunit